MLVRMQGKKEHCWWEWKLVQSLWKTIWRLLKYLNRDLPYNPATLHTPRDILKGFDSGYYKSTSMLMFIAALFTIAKL
jgi:hypothetical protein